MSSHVCDPLFRKNGPQNSDGSVNGTLARKPADARDDRGTRGAGHSRHPIGGATTRRFRTDTASFRAATVAWLYKCRAASNSVRLTCRCRRLGDSRLRFEKLPNTLCAVKGSDGVAGPAHLARARPAMSANPVNHRNRDCTIGRGSVDGGGDVSRCRNDRRRLRTIGLDPKPDCIFQRHIWR